MSSKFEVTIMIIGLFLSIIVLSIASNSLGVNDIIGLGLLWAYGYRQGLIIGDVIHD